MHLELEPPIGITGFRFGMPADEVKAAAAAIGPATVTDEGVAKKWPHMRVLVEHPEIDIFFNLEDGKTLTSVEILRPRSEEVTVTWRGIDVFATRAESLLHRLEADGYRIHDRDSYFPCVMGLSLGLARDPYGDDEFPLDEETGYASYLLRILAGPEAYYDAVVAQIERMGLPDR
jgi:hypothetical protein